MISSDINFCDITFKKYIHDYSSSKKTQCQNKLSDPITCTLPPLSYHSLTTM